MLLLSAALVVTAAGFTAVANDERLLRAGAVAALIAALLPTMLLSRDQRPQPPSAMERELRQLRAEIARLSATVSVLHVAATPTSAPVVLPERTTMLSLPLVRAALQVPVQSANGHKKLIDVTEATLSTHGE